jgi:hypothetical protein
MTSISPNVAARDAAVRRSPATKGGALAWVLSPAQYAVAQLVVATAWTTPYSLRDN